MGSFAYTCGVSGLPIEGGDKVRYLLLSKSPYGESVMPTGQWFPRSFPLRAEYNDYGTVENVEEGIGRELWREAFKIDLVSVGVGNNTCHDVPTSKTMSWKALLNAIREKRVLVRQDLGDSNRITKRLEVYEQPKYVTPEGVPTMQRVKKALAAAGLGLSTGLLSMKNGYMVDKIRYGTIRVRWQGTTDRGNNVEKLTEAQKALSAYATVLKAGEGSYPHESELMVHVHPGVKSFRDRSIRRKKPLLVDHFMVREDVWQGLLSIPASFDYSSKTLSAEDHRQAARKLYKACLKAYHLKLPEMPEGVSPEAAKSLADGISVFKELRPFRMESIGMDNPIVGQWICRDDVPFAVGMGTNWRLLVEKNLPEKEVAGVLDGIAEFVHVLRVLYPTRFQWRPSTSCGPQFGEWGLHAIVNQVFSNIAAGIDSKNAKADAETFTEA